MIARHLRSRTTLHAQRQCFATADTNSGDTTLSAKPLQCRHQRHHDARSAGPERVAKCDRATADIELVVCNAELLHGSQRHDREGLIDLPQIHTVHAPLRSGERLADGNFTPGSFDEEVRNRLAHFAELARKHSHEAGTEKAEKP